MSKGLTCVWSSKPATSQHYQLLGTLPYKSHPHKIICNNSQIDYEGVVDLRKDALLVHDVVDLLQADDVSHGQDFHGQVLVGSLVSAKTDSSECTRSCKKETSFIMFLVMSSNFFFNY